MTLTRSPLLILAAMSDHLRGEGHDLHELVLAQFTTDRSEDTSALGFTAGAENHSGVLVELDVGAVCTAAFLFRFIAVSGPRQDLSVTVRTTTALTTSPFLTDPPGMASLTEATITSPMPA